MGQVSNLTVHIRGLAPAASYLLKTEVSTLISGDDSLMIAQISSIHLDPLDLSLRGSPHLDPLSRKFAYTYHDSISDAFWEEGLWANVRVSLDFSILSFIPHQLHVSIFDASPAVPEENKMLGSLSREIIYHDMLQQRIIVEESISTSAPAESSYTHDVHHQRTNSTAAQGESSYTHASRESRAHTCIRDFAEYCGDLQETVAPGAEQTAVDMPDMFFASTLISFTISHTIPDVSDAAGQHGLHHPAVVVNHPVFECECTEYSPVASSSEYSNVAPSSCKEGGQVDFNVAVRGLVPGFEYELEIAWTLEDDQFAHTWKSVVTAETDSYTLREPLVQRNDDFHFGMMAWDLYKKGDDRFYIDVMVRDRTAEGALIGTRNDTAVNGVRLQCAQHQSAFLANTFSRDPGFTMGMQAQMSADRIVQVLGAPAPEETSEPVHDMHVGQGGASKDDNRDLPIGNKVSCGPLQTLEA
jgi:hypothetical protein